MKWEGNRESDNVEDRRSSGGGMPVFGGRSIGIGTIVIALLGGWATGHQSADHLEPAQWRWCTHRAGAAGPGPATACR